MTGENSLDYKSGHVWTMQAGFEAPAHRRLFWSLELDFHKTFRDAFLGQDVPSTGGHVLYFVPGFRVQGSKSKAFYFKAYVPVHSFVNETNLAPRFGLQVGWDQRVN